MSRYLVKRILTLLFLLWAVSSMIFFLIHLVPGDPVLSILGEGANQADIQRIRSELNLDQPLWRQYLDYNSRLLRLDFGRSIFNSQEVSRNIALVLPNTVILALAAMLLGIMISIPAGAWAAFRENSAWDSLVTFLTSCGLAVPNFLLGPLLVILFSIKLGLLPVSGSETAAHLVLPAMTLGLSLSAFLTRIVKTAVASELRSPYVMLARAKGLNEKQVFFGHILRNAMIPIITTIGLQFGALLTGAIVTETIFSWQGIGILLITAIHRRDYPMVQGVIIFVAFVYLLVNFLVDLTYFIVQPRIRHEIKTS